MGSSIRLAGDIKPVMSGVRSVLKSAPVASMLGRQAAKAAARCNALCSPQMRKAGARYDSAAVQRGYTAGGLVYASGAEDGKFARIDNYRNNTLKKGCGV